MIDIIAPHPLLCEVLLLVLLLGHKRQRQLCGLLCSGNEKFFVMCGDEITTVVVALYSYSL